MVYKYLLGYDNVVQRISNKKTMHHSFLENTKELHMIRVFF